MRVGLHPRRRASRRRKRVHDTRYPARSSAVCLASSVALAEGLQDGAVQCGRNQATDIRSMSATRITSSPSTPSPRRFVACLTVLSAIPVVVVAGFHGYGWWRESRAIAVLRSGSEKEQVAALNLLHETRSVRAVPAVLEYLAEADSWPTRVGGHVDVCMFGRTERDSSVADHAEALLLGLGEEAGAALEASLAHPTPGVRAWATYVIGSLALREARTSRGTAR